MSTEVSWPNRGPNTNPEPYAFAEILRRDLHAGVVVDPPRDHDARVRIHVMASAARVDTACKFWFGADTSWIVTGEKDR
jgi:hypothetical protein